MGWVGWAVQSIRISGMRAGGKWYQGGGIGAVNAVESDRGLDGRVGGISTSGQGRTAEGGAGKHCEDAGGPGTAVELLGEVL